MYPTTHSIPAAAQPLSPWLQEVAHRRKEISVSSQESCIQGVVQRAFDWIIHLFLYHLNFNPNYCAFYDRLREDTLASYPQENLTTQISDPFFPKEGMI